jgi:hypothetical protein
MSDLSKFGEDQISRRTSEELRQGWQKAGPALTSWCLSTWPVFESEGGWRSRAQIEDEPIRKASQDRMRKEHHEKEIEGMRWLSPL